MSTAGAVGRENLGNMWETSSEAPPSLSFQWSKDLALSDMRGHFKVTGLKPSWLGSAQRSVVRENLIYSADDKQSPTMGRGPGLF